MARTRTGSTAGLATRGIARLSSLDAFLPEYPNRRVLNPLSTRRVDAVVGWGHKPTADRARGFAARRGLPYVRLEDGFLRSWGPAGAGDQPLSVIVDYRGIYYDARQPSDLEELIRTAAFSRDEHERACRCIDRIRRQRLSKYNHAPDIPIESTQRSERVLVVDQTEGDCSISQGHADAARFGEMLCEALDRHPDAEILVKIHPDTVAGRKRGHLRDPAAHHPRCRVITEDCNPWVLFDAVDTVHVVTSQLGFEALLAGKRVVCHGAPFFSGWGLTEDCVTVARRGLQRSLETVFAAAYMRYCRYANPYTGERMSLEDTIGLLADQKRQQERLAGDWITGGLPRWKRPVADAFLGRRARVRHARSLARAELQRRASERVLVWSTAGPGGAQPDDRQVAGELWRLEDGFVRSVGLGADLTMPLSMVVDGLGMYYDCSRASDLERILAEAEFSSDLIRRAKQLRERLVALGLSKYNVGGTGLPALPRDRRILLVPGQVESDASIRYGTTSIQTNQQLLEAVRTAEPEAFIIYKPHPDVVSGARLGEVDASADTLFDLHVRDVDISPLLERVDAVHTMTSLTGFEALLRGCGVATYGLPFYAGWGLTSDAVGSGRRQRRLSLDELVAGSLLLYPIYLDPRTRQVCNAETIVSLLEQIRASTPSLDLRVKLYRYYRRLMEGPR